MRATMKGKFKMALLVVTTSLLMASCAAPRKIAYMQEVPSDVRREVAIVPVTAQPGDKVSIVVNSKNPELADMFNLPVMTPYRPTHEQQLQL